MKHTLVLLVGIFAASLMASAQDVPVTMMAQGAGPVTLMAQTAGISIRTGPLAPVQGAPYSATVTIESVQTLADGNRIVQSSSGTTARDSQGRTRQDAPLPPLGNLSAENAPHIVFIMDPVAQVSYTLNLTDKTAQKMPMPPAGAAGAAPGGAIGSSGVVTAGGGDAVYVQSADVPAGAGLMPPPMVMQKFVLAGDSSDAKVEDLGTQTIEGLGLTGKRTTVTIPAGQVGNEQPISIVTEVWSSPDLKTIVSSKRSDPRMGEQTFQLSNITRAEPDASLFTVPADFKIVEGPQRIMYGVNK